MDCEQKVSALVVALVAALAAAGAQAAPAAKVKAPPKPAITTTVQPGLASATPGQTQGSPGERKH